MLLLSAHTVRILYDSRTVQCFIVTSLRFLAQRCNPTNSNGENNFGLRKYSVTYFADFAKFADLLRLCINFFAANYKTITATVS